MTFVTNPIRSFVSIGLLYIETISGNLDLMRAHRGQTPNGARGERKLAGLKLDFAKYTLG